VLFFVKSSRSEASLSRRRHRYRKEKTIERGKKSRAELVLLVREADCVGLCQEAGPLKLFEIFCEVECVVWRQ